MKRLLITAVCTLLAFPAMAQEDALKGSSRVRGLW